MKTIDAHVHLGDCRMCEYDNVEDDVLHALEENEVSTAILQPFPYAKDIDAVHARISALSRKFPGRVYGIVSVNPHCDVKAYRIKVQKIIDGGGFVAIKLHTLGHAIFPDAKDANAVYEIASERALPVMVHTGLTNFGEPALVVGPALRYPGVNFILAHSGWGGTSLRRLQPPRLRRTSTWRPPGYRSTISWPRSTPSAHERSCSDRILS